MTVRPTRGLFSERRAAGEVRHKGALRSLICHLEKDSPATPGCQIEADLRERRDQTYWERIITTAMQPWLLVELGGSSTQTVQRDAEGRFWFTAGLVREPGRPVALACPGVIRNGRVLYATNLGWSDDADPARELGLEQIAIVENDAVAAALGESVLRSSERSLLDSLYVTLGTGVGSAQVIDGVATVLDLGHHYIGGNAYCTGCRSVGCLNAYLCAQHLPVVLSSDDQAFVARTLGGALRDMAVAADLPLVLGGGITRRYPAIATLLNDVIPHPTERTAAPAEAKSAAYAGLDYPARLHETTVD